MNQILFAISDQHTTAASKPAGVGRRYWRSLEEFCDTDEFRRLVQREYPSQAAFALDPLNRRKFLSLMGASLALAGASGCSITPAPTTEIVPYVRRPEDIVPGKPLFFASAMAHDGAAVGLLIETHEGRPTKVEGNPDHPASLGATSAIHQASVLDLYDPDRSQSVRYLGETRTWDDAIDAFRAMMSEPGQQRGGGLRLLIGTVASPTLRRQLESLQQRLPDARLHTCESAPNERALQAARAGFGEHGSPRYDFTKADVVLSLDADFLYEGPGHLRYAADFISRRRVRTSAADARQATMNRLYVVEPAVTCTGAKADHRLALRASEVEAFARSLAREAGLSTPAAAHGDVRSRHSTWISAVAHDLEAHRGRCLVIAGDRQPASVQLLAIALNDHFGNIGQTVEYTRPIASLLANGSTTDWIGSFRDLTDAMGQGAVKCLVILGGNPVYTAPADIPFAENLAKVPLRLRLGLHEDETSRLCQWHLPETHFMEAWSDAIAYDGTATIVQPVIEPLYEGRSAHEVVAILTDSREVPGRAIVREYWANEWKLDLGSSEFETRWQTALHDGVVEGTRLPAQTVTLNTRWQSELARESSQLEGSQNEDPTSSLEIAFAMDPSICDGRFANNGWLQELPKPITKITWGNTAIVSPATAKRLGLGMGSYAHGGEHGGYHMPVVTLTLDGRSVDAPLWIMPGHADDAVTVHLGFGRRHAGRIGGSSDETVGFNANLLRTANSLWFARDLKITATDQTEIVACTQAHHQMEGRDSIRAASLNNFQEHPNFVSQAIDDERRERTLRAADGLSLLTPHNYDPPRHKWGMLIDLTSCIGCNACVAACQAENNIPVVGKDEVSRGREMHWIRIDRYVAGDADVPKAFHFQPLPCMHCENAPCEYVCPVEATVHSADGLNDMIYNRCVGTRFCSNNCPYKVRRFNFLAYSDFDSPGRRMQYNPDVTVRSRGVMEKCTYCVQRIRHAEIGAETEDRPLVDGDVITACQAACPTQAIVFGDLNDPQSQVKQAKDSPLHYSLLDEELNTRPRTTYLAELRNPNPDWEGG